MNEEVDSQKQDLLIKDDKDIFALIKDMLLRLESIEEKIDSLMKQSQEKSYNAKVYARPQKSFEKPKHYKDRKRDGKKEEVSSEGKFYHGRPFDKSKNVSKSNFKGKKKPIKRAVRK